MKKENLSLNNFVRKAVKPLLTFKMGKHSEYSKEDILSVLMEASSLTTFTEGTSNALNKNVKKVPNGDTVLLYLKSTDKKKLDEVFFGYIKDNVKFLKARGKLSRHVGIGMDWVDLMFYGDPNTSMVIGTKHKNGSSYAYEYLTASLLVDGERIILGVLPIQNRSEIANLTIKLIQFIQYELKIKIGYMVFDKGFFILQLIKFLEDSKINYELPIHNTTRVKKMSMKPDERVRYKSNNHHKGKGQYKTEFNVVCIYDENIGQKYFVATNMKSSPKILLQKLKSRWGVETSYRVSNQFLIKTTSKVYVVRLFFYLFACLMQNVWVLLNLINTVYTTVTELKIVFLHELSTVTYINNLNSYRT